MDNTNETNQKLTGKKRVVICALAILFLSLVLELFVFNFSYFRYGKVDYIPTVTAITNIESEGGDSYSLVDESQNGVINVNLAKKKANKITVEIKGVKNDEAIYSISSNEKELGTRRAFDGIKTINTGKNNGSINLNLEKMGNKDFQVVIHAVSNFNFNWIRFIVIIVMSTSGFLAFYLVINKKYHYAALISILVFGCISALLVPPMHTYDEKEHLYRAFSVSEGNLFYSNGEKITLPHGLTEMYGTVPVENGGYHSIEEFQEFKETYSGKEYKKLEKKSISTTAATYPFFIYIFEAIGIIAAKIFGVGMLSYIWFGRIANVIAYAFLAFFAIKKLPRGKLLLTALSMQPVLIYLAGANGFDSVMLGFSFLGIAEILRIRASGKIMSTRSLMLILTCFSFFIFAKMTNVPILLFFFLLKKENFSSKNDRRIKSAIVSVGMVVVALLAYLYSSHKGLAQWGIPGASTTGQIKLILFHPWYYIRVLFNFFGGYTFSFTESIFGALGYLEGLHPFVLGVNLVNLIFISLFGLSKKEQEQSLNYFTPFDKALVAVSSLGMIVLSATALYVTFTVVGKFWIDGYQPRYLLPLVFPVLLSLSSTKIRSSFSMKNVRKISIAISIFVCIIYIWQSIIVPFYF